MECRREQQIFAAVARWRETQSDADWTTRLDGWRGNPLDWRSAPARVLDAILGAIPMPATFTAAAAEMAYWTQRNAEIEDVLAVDGPFAGDHALDLPAAVRWEMVRALARHELPTLTLQELHARFAILRASEVDEPEIETALFRDLGMMVAREAKTVTVTDLPTAAVHRGHLAELLREHPDWSDRRIARTLQCSPTTVGRARRAIDNAFAA